MDAKGKKKEKPDPGDTLHTLTAQQLALLLIDLCGVDLNSTIAARLSSDVTEMGLSGSNFMDLDLETIRNILLQDGIPENRLLPVMNLHQRQDDGTGAVPFGFPPLPLSSPIISTSLSVSMVT